MQRWILIVQLHVQLNIPRLVILDVSHQVVLHPK